MGYWTLLALWLWQGGTVSTQPANVPQLVAHARTLADVEAELVAASRVRALARAKYARNHPSFVNRNLCNEALDYVRDENSLLDEWAYWRYDDQPITTRTGGMHQRVDG